jgi:UDP-2-acetamido-3-amino-2,3-dideoxy-glucuronate N-acetyltransferase
MSDEGLRFLSLKEYADERGRLRVVEVGGCLPFTPLRSFIISDIPNGKTRAGHALSCEMFLVVILGACLLTAMSAAGVEQHLLTPAKGGVYLPPGTWLLLSDFEPETIVVVYASETFDRTRYFTDYVDPAALRGLVE